MISVRHATADDLEQVVAIYNATVPGRMATADTDPVTVQSRRNWFHAHEPHSRPLYVAEADGRVAAYLSFRNFYGRPAYHITAELGLYVHDDFRRRGLGSLLLQHGIEQARSLGIENMLAFVFAHNTPSIGFFQKHGFERWGLLPSVAELDGRCVDLAVLGRKVGRQAKA